LNLQFSFEILLKL